MTPPVIVAISLKMYFSQARTVEYCRRLAALARASEAVRSDAVELVVLPTFVSVPAALQATEGSGVRVGAQDLAVEDSGAFTGEVSGAELAEVGCTHVEVGHAERRTLFGETEAVVAAKTRAALRNGLVPILCVGEPDLTDPGTAADICTQQVRSALDQPGDHPATGRMIIAYEPYWAIGAPRPAPTDYVAEVCRRLRTSLAGAFEHQSSEQPATSIIYGGSAGPGLLSDLGEAVDGLFLGRFAHDPDAVAAILSEASLRT